MGVNFSDPRSKVTLGGKPVTRPFSAAHPLGTTESLLFKGYAIALLVAQRSGMSPRLYAVMGGNYFGPNCCFDYGNAETGTKIWN